MEKYKTEISNRTTTNYAPSKCTSLFTLSIWGFSSSSSYRLSSYEMILFTMRSCFVHQNSSFFIRAAPQPEKKAWVFMVLNSIYISKVYRGVFRQKILKKMAMSRSSAPCMA
jgi:hypothetical protein